MTNAGQNDSRMINRAIQLAKNSKHSLAYLDDVITFKSLGEHAEHVEAILAMHSAFGLKIESQEKSGCSRSGNLFGTSGVKGWNKNVRYAC